MYMSENTFTVTLTVTDDEGETDTDTTTACIGCVAGAFVIMDDVTIPCDDGIQYGYLHATGISQQVGSGYFELTWDPNEVFVASLDNYEFDSLEYNLDNVNGELIILAWESYGNYLTGDFNIARIGFEAVGAIGCDVVIEDSELLTDDPIPDEILHASVNGYVDITCNPNGNIPGNMNGDKSLNAADVRYLALHLLSKPGYENLHGCNPDVNCVGGANAADVRYLALHIAQKPGYEVIYPSCAAFI